MVVCLSCMANNSKCCFLQCFDLDAYLKRKGGRGEWKCPVCDGAVHIDSLQRDEYMEKILTDTV